MFSLSLSSSFLHLGSSLSWLARSFLVSSFTRNLDDDDDDDNDDIDYDDDDDNDDT